VNLGISAATHKVPGDEKLALCGFSIINISTADRAACGKALQPGRGERHCSLADAPA
jgi:hypothetical protein